jgi:hypothetical protein
MVLSGELSVGIAIAKGRSGVQVRGQCALEGRSHCEMYLLIQICAVECCSRLVDGEQIAVYKSVKWESSKLAGARTMPR